jgi:hypothetical protein
MRGAGRAARLREWIGRWMKPSALLGLCGNRHVVDRSGPQERRERSQLTLLVLANPIHLTGHSALPPQRLTSADPYRVANGQAQ